jgi:hypothetical protein
MQFTPMPAREQRPAGPGGCPMDLALVAATVAFFGATLAYVRWCDRL